MRARPLWTILSSQRVSAGVVGWPVSAPAAPLRGFLITDEFEPGRRASGAAGGSTAFGAPAEAVLRATAVAGGPLAVHAGSVEDPPLARDAWRREIAVQLRDEYRPRLLAVRYEGIDRAGHLYLQHARPRAFGGSGQDGEARLAAILDRHYAFLDAEIAHALDTMGPDDVLLVVSGFGMEPVGLGKRLLARVLGQPDVPGSHEDAPGRLPAGLRRADAIRARAPGIDRRRRAHRPLPARPPRRARHGRHRPHRPLQARLHRHPPHRLHPHLRAVGPRPGLAWAEAGSEPGLRPGVAREEAGHRPGRSRDSARLGSSTPWQELRRHGADAR